MNQLLMTLYGNSAIIGYRRSGASPEDIAKIAGVTLQKVFEVIEDYKKHLDKNSIGNL